jgi:hypothetical protein
LGGPPIRFSNHRRAAESGPAVVRARERQALAPLSSDYFFLVDFFELDFFVVAFFVDFDFVDFVAIIAPSRCNRPLVWPANTSLYRFSTTSE